MRYLDKKLKKKKKEILTLSLLYCYFQHSTHLSSSSLSTQALTSPYLFHTVQGTTQKCKETV